MVKVLYVVRKTRSNSGRHVLYCRISLNGQSREISTNEYVVPSKWDQERQCYAEDSQAEFVNLVCERLKYRIKRIYLSADPEEEITTDTIIERLKKPKAQRAQLVEVVQGYIDFIRKQNELALPEDKLNEDTIAHYDCYLRNLRAFAVKPLYISEVTLGWATLFKLFLKEHKNCLRKTRASRHVEFFITALNHAVTQKIIKDHELKGYEIERDKKKAKVWLSKHEISQFVNIPIPEKTLEKARVLTVYTIHTGVEFSNIWSKFEVQEVLVKNKIQKIIIGTRNKGNNPPFFLPYHPVAEALLQQYKGELPKLDNSTYNKALKCIALLYGINKNLTTHIGRKTFINTMKADGWSPATIQGMAGHESLRTTEDYYLGTSPDRLINEMALRPA